MIGEMIIYFWMQRRKNEKTDWRDKWKLETDIHTKTNLYSVRGKLMESTLAHKHIHTHTHT